MKTMANNLLNVKQRQTYLKLLGLYTKKIDGVNGTGTKKAIEYFNTIFLNSKTSTYSAKTDTKLREVVASYKKSQYMTTKDWDLFKNFNQSEFHCTCNGKYCDGYNGRKNKCPMKLIMVAQYLRNYYNQPLYISSSIRCKKRNQQVGGVNNSKHLVFQAIDSKTGTQKASAVVKLLKSFPLVKYTYAINNTYVHFNI